MKDDDLLWPCKLPCAARAALLNAAQFHTLHTDDHLSLGRGSMNGLFYVMRGIVVAGIPNLAKSSPFVLFKAGEWFGGTVIYNGADFQYRITSLEASRIVFIPGKVIRDTAENHRELFRLLYLVTSERARVTLEMLFASSGMTLTQKVAYFLLEVAKRFPRVAGATPMISMSQTMLARMLGLSRLSLNRQLHLLAEQNIIAIERKKVFIVDLPLLESLTAIQP
jgi:CRP-like cAMP-binding protein